MTKSTKFNEIHEEDDIILNLKDTLKLKMHVEINYWKVSACWGKNNWLPLFASRFMVLIFDFQFYFWMQESFYKTTFEIPSILKTQREKVARNSWWVSGVSSFPITKLNTLHLLWSNRILEFWKGITSNYLLP